MLYLTVYFLEKHLKVNENQPELICENYNSSSDLTGSIKTLCDSEPDTIRCQRT